ncbi:MAG: PDZ domain-containing protein [Chloroflexota bacterium]
MREQFQMVGGSDAQLREVTGEVRPTVVAMRRAAEAGERPITTMLAADYTAFCDVALTYGLLWVSGHRAQAAAAERPTYRIGENHQNAYAGAAQEIVKLIADVLGWELDQADEPCRCYCPSCSGLGMCICLGVGRDLMVSAWADTAVAPEQGMVVRTLRAGGPAALAGLQAGDVVVRIGEEDVSDMWKFNGALRAARQAAPAGQPLAMHVRRGEAELSLTLSPPAR